MNIAHISQHIAEHITPDNNDYIISINNFDMPLAKLHKKWNDRLLYLVFDDISLNMRIWSVEKKCLVDLILFNNEHAMKILNFINDNRNNINNLYIHCTAGVSRSAGVAKAVSDIYNECSEKYESVKLYNSHVYKIMLKVAHKYNKNYPLFMNDVKEETIPSEKL